MQLKGHPENSNLNNESFAEHVSNELRAINQSFESS
jgi:hypothetical protein